MLSTIQEMSSNRRRSNSATLKSIYRTSSAGSVKKYSTLNPQESVKNNQEPVTGILAFFEKKRFSTKPSEDPEEELARLDAQIKQIRGNLEAMSMERENLTARVTEVRTRVDSISSTDSRQDSIEAKTIPTSPLSSSTTLSDDSFKRDSGYVFDPEFEVDNRKITIPNNSVSLSSLPKKARSTTALDFIRNDLYQDDGKALKATSIDRISCYSDSALLGLVRGGRQ